MSKFYSDNIQEQIDDLFYVKPKAVAEPVVSPVVEEVVEPKQKSVIKEEVYYTEEEPVSYIEQMAQQMSRVNKRTNAAAGQEKLTVEQATMENFQHQLDRMKRSILENTIVTGIGQGGDGQTPGSGEVKLNRMDDVNLGSGLNDGDVLIWDNDNGTWRPGTPGAGGGADLLNDLEARVAILESKLDPLQGGDADSPTTGDPS